MGLYLSGHPLTPYLRVVKEKTNRQIGDLKDEDDIQVTVAGVVSQYRRQVTKKGQMMSSFRLEDLTGSIEVLVFPKLFDVIGASLNNDLILLARGRWQGQDEQPKLFLDRAEMLGEVDLAEAAAAANEAGAGAKNKLPPWVTQDIDALESKARATENRQIWISLPDQESEDKAVLTGISSVLEAHRGRIPVFLYYAKQKQPVAAGFLPKGDGSQALITELRRLLGDNKVVLQEKK
jgi:DNA polymerase-3 subunit alpha